MLRIFKDGKEIYKPKPPTNEPAWKIESAKNPGLYRGTIEDEENTEGKLTDERSTFDG